MSRIVGNILRRCRRIDLSRFARDRRGVSAVEFALLSPVLIGLYLGGVEISQGIGIDRKVTLTAGAIADLSAQVTSISSSDMTNIMNAATAIIAPYPTGPLKITVSCLAIDNNKSVTVKWSATQGGTARSAGSSVTIPDALTLANTQLLFSEVSYDYTPSVGYVITGTLNLSDTMYMSPRISAPTYGTTACS
jgi:Flp pilus assembly protein TadG